MRRSDAVPPADTAGDTGPSPSCRGHRTCGQHRSGGRRRSGRGASARGPCQRCGGAARPRQAVVARPGRSAVPRDRRHRAPSAGRSTPSCGRWPRRCRRPADWPSPLRVVDLGCGNAYLTFAAYRYLTGRGAKVQVVGVDVREDQRVRNTAVAADLGCAADVHFVAGTIEDAPRSTEPPIWCSRCTPATPRPTRRWPGRCAGTPAGCSPRRAATTTSPPSSRAPRPRALRRAHPAPDPARTLRRRADRLAAGVAAADATATGWTWWSSSTPRTPRATCCSAPAAPASPASATNTTR